jgi:hypothetical protein
MQDDKDDKFNLRVKQVFIGLGSGFIGMVAFAGLIPPTDLYADIRNALLAGIFTMIAAIALVTYLHNRQREKRTNQSK